MPGANGNGRKNGKAKGPAKGPALVPQVHGGALLAGPLPGRRIVPGSGRPPDKFRRRMQAAATWGAKQAYLLTCLSGGEGWVAYFRAMDYCADRGYGAPEEHIDHSGDLGLTIRVVRPE